MQPQFPIFIPTLSRYDSRLTIKALQRMGIEKWYAVVEPQEYEMYASVITKEHILTLDMAYKQSYQTLDALGTAKSTGSGPARNFIWDTSINMGYPWHWIMDDNIVRFLRYTNNLRYEVLDGAFFRVLEDFCLRYENVGMAGPNYEMFVPRKQKHSPVVFNTRIYSCNLIRNDIPYRWRGRYNEDTILSLDMLRDGWCTALFNTFQQKKLTTQTVKGGNTDTIYVGGTYPKSKMLVDLYPEYARHAHKFGRDHHHVDYRPFRRNQVKRKDGIMIPEGPNEYGMALRRIAEGE
jgi:hypothetical protein